MKKSSNIFITVFILLIALTASKAQEVDDLRLGYDTGKDALTQLKVVSSPDGKYLAIAYENVSDTLKGVKEKFSSNTLKIFDVKAQRFIYSLNKIALSSHSIVFSKNQLMFLTTILLGGLKYEIHLNVFDIATNKIESISVPIRNVDDFTSSMFSEEYQLILFDKGKPSLPQNRLIIAFDAKSFTEKYSISIGNIESGSKIVISPTGKYIAYVTPTKFNGKNEIRLLDASTGKEITSYGGDTKYAYISFDLKENLVCLVDNDLGKKGNKSIKVISTADRSLKEYRLPGLEYASADFLELNGDNLLLGAETEFKVLNINDGSIRYRMNPDNKVYAVASFGMYHSSDLVRLGNNKYLLYNKGFKKQKKFLYFNSSKIFDLNTIQMSGYFYSDGSDSFAVVARDGRVDGDMDALKNVYWTSRKSAEKTYLDRTLDKNFTPKLLGQLLSNENASQSAFDIDKAIGKIPVVALKSFNGVAASGAAFKVQSKTNKLEVTIAANAQEIEEVRLHHNGKLIRAQTNNGTTQYNFDVTLTNAFGASNFFFITATSKSGVEAEKVKFTVEYSGISSANPKLYLLTIGINQYRNPKYNLNYAQADADGVENYIKANSVSLFPEIITYNIRNDKAVKANIITALNDIKDKTLEQDVLIVYYAGHGVMSGQELQQREFFLVPFDVTQIYGRDDLLREKGISAAELRNYSQSINAQKQVFILDACQSSGALESLAVRGAAEEKAIAQLARSTGTFWITSTGTNQFATEFDKLGHGVFTHTLLEGIKGQGDANKDKKLTVRELSTFVENLVPDLTEKLNGTPQFPSAYSFGNDFILMTYK